MHRSPAFSFIGKLSCLPAVLLLVVTPAVAEEREWINPAGGLFGDDSHWLDNAVPGTSDAAVFHLEADYSVFFDTNYTNDRLLVREGDVTFTTAPGAEPWGYELTNPSTSANEQDNPSIVSFMVAVEAGDEAGFVLNGGTIEGVQGSIGDQAGSTGNVQITDSASLNLSSRLSVGTAGTGLLAIDDGSTLQSHIVRIGDRSTGDGSAVVSGPGSTWTNAFWFDVGGHGSGELTIEDGGQVTSQRAVIASYGGSQGHALVTGADSNWTLTGDMWGREGWLKVGRRGAGSLLIADGGTVYSREGHIGAEGGSEGTVTVTGEGSTWTIERGHHLQNQTLYVGRGFLGTGAKGTLLIDNGGSVVTVGMTIIGDMAGDEGTVTVRDPGSSLQVTDIIVGNGGTAELLVENGGVVSSSYGFTTIGANGTATVRGAGSQWQNADDLNVRNTNGGGLIVEDGGEVYSENGLINSDTTATALVTGPGSTWTIDEQLTIGQTGGGTLTVADGGTVTSDLGIIGEEAGSTGEVTVTGANSSWTIGHTLNVGHSGTGELTITDGGTVSGWNHVIGREAGSTGVVTVTGEGSTWATSGGALDVGRAGDGSLTIEAGGTVSNANGWIGAHGGEGEVLVTGPGSTWTSDGQLTVGYYSHGALTVADGGAVFNHKAGIGIDAEVQGQVLVTGQNSAWTSDGSLTVGHNGNGALTVTDGGVASNHEGIVGNAVGSQGVITVTGTGSTWTTAGNLDIGRHGTGTLTIADGGTMMITDGGPTAGGILGSRAGSTGTALITGQGSTWNSSSHIFVGRHGTGEMTVEAGGTVISTAGRIGRYASGDGSVTVTGEDSNWTIDGPLLVGQEGSGTLTVADGGAVSSGPGMVGAASDSNGAATVTGADSTWSVNGLLTVGHGGAGQLTVADGGTVTSAGGSLGQFAGATGSATVTGQDSTWSSSSAVNVGVAGEGTLTLTDGGHVDTTHVHLGFSPSGYGETLVQGADSLLATGVTVVGLHGTGNMTVEGGTLTADQWLIIGAENSIAGYMTVRDGGSVVMRQGTLGKGIDTYGQLTVTGEGSSYTYDNWIRIGHLGEAHVTIEDGATVSGTSATIAIYGGSEASVTVTGEGSSWTHTDTLHVGGSEDPDSTNLLPYGGGHGSLIIDNGATVSNADAFVGTFGSATNMLGITSKGIVKVRGQGSTWTSTGSVYIGSNHDTIPEFPDHLALSLSSGHLIVADGGKVIAQGEDGLTLRETGTLTGGGGTIEANVTNEGVVRPGSDTAAGTLTLDGDYTQSDLGTLAIALAGSAAGEVSQLLVTGHADLAGTLDLTLLDDFAPSYGDSFDILQFDSLSGTFDEVLGTDLGGLYFEVVEHDDRLTLETLASPGNMNLDGQIDFDDINAFLLALNDPAAYEAQYGLDPILVGDINGDGQFDFDDINPFIALLQGDSAVVPEPGTLAMMGVGGLMLLRRQRQVRLNSDAGR